MEISLKKMKVDRTYEEAEQESLDLPNSLQIFLAIKTVSASGGDTGTKICCRNM